MLWGAFANESVFCIIYSCTVADTLGGDKGIRTDPVGFAEEVCIKCSCLADQPSQAVALVELTNTIFCSNNTGPAILGVFQLMCCAVEAGDRGEVLVHVAELNRILAGHYDIC